MIPNSDITVYVATHGPKCEALQDYTEPIEVGAAIREQFNYSLRDDSSEDNISSKNKTWCELTALYWIWKNDKSKITGLYHYRRLFRLSKEQIKQILERYDVITAECNIKDTIKESYQKQCPSGSFDVLLGVIKDKMPEYYAEAVKHFNEHRYFACQMIVAKKEWVNHYCEWLFDILEEVERRMRPDQIDPRYMGYIGEVLMLGFYIRITNAKHYDVNICQLMLGDSVKERFLKSDFYCSHFANRLKVSCLDILYKLK